MSLYDVFFDCASVLTKAVAEMTFTLAYVLNVAFVALYHTNEIRGRAGDVMSRYTSLFVGREKSVRRGSLSNERTRFSPISVTMESSRNRGGGGGGWGCLRCLALISKSRTFLQRRYDIRGREENAARHRCEERTMLKLLEMT